MSEAGDDGAGRGPGSEEARPDDTGAVAEKGLTEASSTEASSSVKSSSEKSAMEESTLATRKMDPHLRRTLEDARSAKELQVIVTVRGAAPPVSRRRPAAGQPAVPEHVEDRLTAPHPKDYPDRVAYRQAMIEHHEQRPGDRVQSARAALQTLGLTVQGGGPSGLLMVRGRAEAVLRMLTLEVVERASLDRAVERKRGGSVATEESTAEKGSDREDDPGDGPRSVV